jgi:hypothetical protein
MSYRNWTKKLSLFVPGRLTPIRSKVHVLHGMSWGVNADGTLSWIDPWTSNILHDAGEQYILSAVFATTYSNYGAALSALFLGLDNRTTLAEADTLATLTGEPSAGGYARKSISTAGTGAGGQPFVLSQPGAYYIATSATQTWTASGAAYGTVRNRFLASDLTAVTDGDDDHLLASLALSTPRTINDGDTLNTNLAIGLSE